MPQIGTINPRIIESLYCEALVLADEVRVTVALSNRLDPPSGDDDLARVAMSCESLRTTTRMMHAIAWLLNQRAYIKGEISEFQLRRYGRLAVDVPLADTDRVSLLEPAMRELVLATERFYTRLQRLDHGWRERRPVVPGAIDRLRARLAAVPADA